MPYSLILDVLVAVLLVVTICYAVTLNKRLTKLRRNKAALEKLAVTFGDSTARAEESIERLKNTTELLQDRIEKAQSLRDDLAFLIDRGGQAADKLEDLVRATRDKAGVSPPSANNSLGGIQNSPLAAVPELEEIADEAVDETRSEAERDLLKAIRSVG